MKRTHPWQRVLGIMLCGILLGACVPVHREPTNSAEALSPATSATATNSGAITVTNPLTTSVAPTATQTTTPPVVLNEHTVAPTVEWTAVINQTADKLALVAKDGKTVEVFTAGGALGEIGKIIWSPDQHYLLFVLNNWRHDPATGVLTPTNRPLQLWRVTLENQQVSHPQIVFTAPLLPNNANSTDPGQIVFGQWSPNQRYLIFWTGILSASILADGLPLWLLDVETGQANVASVNADGTPSPALVNSGYQSWAPDSSALAVTVGGYRSAQVHKWLTLYDVAFRQAKVIISDTQQIPGIVAWSPRGKWLAYAAVPADQTGDQWADLMTFANPAIAGRRVYLLNPATGEHRRLNQVDAFQDAPTWSRDGQILYYVERDGDQMRLLATNLTTGQTQAVEQAARPAPPAVGYYGQGQWGDLLAYRPDAPRAELPSLTETYTDPTYGFSLRYPAGWDVLKDTTGSPEVEGIALLQAPATTPADLASFSGKAVITLAIRKGPVADLNAFVTQLLGYAGPGQYVENGHPLSAYHQTKFTVATFPAMRLGTLDEFGVVNHLLVIANGTQALVLRGQGDGRLFDAVVKTLQLP